jgi:flagellar hook assembly protein FlgD
MSAQVITVLDSGGTKSVKWDQKDSNGQQVGPGNYTASISTGLLTANKTFSILQ